MGANDVTGKPSLTLDFSTVKFDFSSLPTVEGVDEDEFSCLVSKAQVFPPVLCPEPVVGSRVSRLRHLPTVNENVDTFRKLRRVRPSTGPECDILDKGFTVTRKVRRSRDTLSSSRDSVETSSFRAPRPKSTQPDLSFLRTCHEAVASRQEKRALQTRSQPSSRRSSAQFPANSTLVADSGSSKSQVKPASSVNSAQNVSANEMARQSQVRGGAVGLDSDCDTASLR